MSGFFNISGGDSYDDLRFPTSAARTYTFSNGETEEVITDSIHAMSFSGFDAFSIDYAVSIELYGGDTWGDDAGGNFQARVKYDDTSWSDAVVFTSRSGNDAPGEMMPIVFFAPSGKYITQIEVASLITPEMGGNTFYCVAQGINL